MGKNIIPKRTIVPEDKTSKKIKNKSQQEKKEMDNKILEAEKEIINHKREERIRKEKMVIKNMNKKTKIFHDFIKNKENKKKKKKKKKKKNQKKNKKFFDNIQEDDI